jgi:hypothetical protein
LDDPTDHLSPAGRHVLALDPQAYRELVVTGEGHQPARAVLEKLSAADLVVPQIVRQPEAQAMLCGLWLWHDWLEQSHAIAQTLESETGSFWHAIMHRREGDFANSKYWYRRCRAHPAMSVLHAQAAALINPLPADKLLLRLSLGEWDPAALVDLVEVVHCEPQDPRRDLAVALQRLEWQVLFYHCTRLAAGRPA